MAGAPEDLLLGTPQEAEDYRVWKESRDRASTYLPRKLVQGAEMLVGATPLGTAMAATVLPKNLTPEGLGLGERVANYGEGTSEYAYALPDPALPPRSATEVARMNARADAVSAEAEKIRAARSGSDAVDIAEHFANRPSDTGVMVAPGQSPPPIQITPGEPPVRPPPPTMPASASTPPYERELSFANGFEPPTEYAATPTQPPKMGGTATPAERVARMMGEDAKTVTQDPSAVRRITSQIQEATAESIRPPLPRASVLSSAADFLSAGAAGLAPFVGSMALGAHEFATMNPEGDLRYMSHQLNRGPLGPAEVGKYATYLQENPDVLNRLYHDRVISSEMYWALTPPSA